MKIFDSWVRSNLEKWCNVYHPSYVNWDTVVRHFIADQTHRNLEAKEIRLPEIVINHIIENYKSNEVYYLYGRKLKGVKL